MDAADVVNMPSKVAVRQLKSLTEELARGAECKEWDLISRSGTALHGTR